MPNFKLNNLTDYLYLVLLVSFFVLPFYVFFLTKNSSYSQETPGIFVASTEGISLRVYPEKNSYAPNEEAKFFIEAKGVAENTAVNALSLAVFIPKTLNYPKTATDSSIGIIKEIPDSFLIEYKSIEAFRDSEYNQVILSLVKQPGSTFNVTKSGTKLISFKVSSPTVGNYNIKFRDIEPVNSFRDVDGVELFNGTATPSVFVIALNPTPTPVVSPTQVPTPTTVVPTPTPTVVVTPTPVSLGSVTGINLTIALQGRNAPTTTLGNSYPSVFVGLWRESTKTMLVSKVVATSTLGVAEALDTFLSANGTAFNLQASDVIIVKPESYLSKSFTVDSLAQSSNRLILPSSTYLAGDVSIETGSFDIVNAPDYLFSWAYYGSGKAYYPYFVDYTGDYKVTIFDLNYFSTNFGKSGSTVQNPEMQKQMENLLRSNMYKVIPVTN